jgi:ABC-type histidine transport system ATPase subunit
MSSIDFRNNEVAPSVMKGGKEVLNTQSCKAAKTSVLTIIGASNSDMHSFNRDSRSAESGQDSSLIGEAPQDQSHPQ